MSRIIEIDAGTEKTRAVVTEEPKTLFCYSGKKFRRDLGEGKDTHAAACPGVSQSDKGDS